MPDAHSFYNPSIFSEMDITVDELVSLGYPRVIYVKVNIVGDTEVKLPLLEVEGEYELSLNCNDGMYTWQKKGKELSELERVTWLSQMI